MNPEGKTPDQILQGNERCPHSSWHFFQARSWIDYAKRTNSPQAIHYTAFEIRYGIEELIFELLVLTKKGLSESEYKKCIGAPNTMRKLLEKEDVSYTKLLVFTQIVMEMDTDPNKPKLRYWKLKELFKYWGKASDYLHYCGLHRVTYDSEKWIISAISELDKISNIFWRAATETVGYGLMSPDRMKEHAAFIWADFKNDKITETDVRKRLELVKPLTTWEKQNLTMRRS